MEPQTQDHGPILTPREARQGRSGRRIFVVLTVSLALALAVLAIIYIIWEPALDQAEPDPPTAATAPLESSAPAPG